jgi:hypothetical protein
VSRHPECDSAWKALWSDITDYADDDSRVNYERLCAAIENYAHKRTVARLSELATNG